MRTIRTYNLWPGDICILVEMTNNLFLPGPRCFCHALSTSYPASYYHFSALSCVVNIMSSSTTRVALAIPAAHPAGLDFLKHTTYKLS